MTRVELGGAILAHVVEAAALSLEAGGTPEVCIVTLGEWQAAADYLEAMRIANRTFRDPRYYTEPTGPTVKIEVSTSAGSVELRRSRDMPPGRFARDMPPGRFAIMSRKDADAKA